MAKGVGRIAGFAPPAHCTGKYRPQVRHWYRPWIGHIGESCRKSHHIALNRSVKSCVVPANTLRLLFILRRFWFALRLLRNLFENVLNTQTSPLETHSMAVHQVEGVTPGPVDTGDALQVNWDIPTWPLRANSLPAVSEFGRKGPSQPPFDLQHQMAVAISRLNLIRLTHGFLNR
jgi:hypothetical protein